MAKPIPPSVGTLWNILKHIANFTARAVFGIDTWDKVDRAYDKLVTWFNLLFDYVTDYAAWYGELILTTPYAWLHSLHDWRILIEDVVNDLVAWWTLAVRNVVTWLVTAKAKIAYICVTSYAFVSGFIKNYASWVQSWLGAAWIWVKKFWANPVGYVESYLGAAWTWIKAFFAAPVATIQNYLKPAWDWIKAFYANPLGVIEGYLGLAWGWAKAWFAAPLAVLHSIIGGALQFLLDLFKLNPVNVLAFARDALAYWYNIWSAYRSVLLAFLHDPGGFLLDMIYPLIEEWANDWLYDHW